MIGAMLTTRLTERLGLAHPVILAPMAFAAGGRLAAAVSRAGGLGLIGGGYVDRSWIDAQFDEAGGADVGCGFITWSLARRPDLLDHSYQVVVHAPNNRTGQIFVLEFHAKAHQRTHGRRRRGCVEVVVPCEPVRLVSQRRERLEHGFLV